MNLHEIELCFMFAKVADNKLLDAELSASKKVSSRMSVRRKFSGLVTGREVEMRKSRETELYKYFDSNVTLGWRVVCRISKKKGDAMVLAGEAEAALDCDGVTPCYRAIRADDTDMAASHSVSSAAFSRAEIEAIVGIRGRSRTARMSNLKKLARMKRGIAAEDFVERARNKYGVYRSVR